MINIDSCEVSVLKKRIIILLISIIMIPLIIFLEYTGYIWHKVILRIMIFGMVIEVMLKG